MADELTKRMEIQDLLGTVQAFVQRFCILPVVAYLPLSLWIIATYLAKVFECFPYLALLSPVKGCGKTRALEVLELLVRLPWRGTSPSPAALYRMMAEGPTLLLDEAEIFNGKNKSESAQVILAILNAGHRKGATIPRCDGPQHALKYFSVYGPKAFAAIGRLPETLLDRSINVAMQRRAIQQPVERFLAARAGAEARPIREATAQFSKTSEESVYRAYEELMNADLRFLADREADLWMPLFAVCTIVAPSRISELKKCAEKLSADKADADVDDSLSMRLLEDVAAVWPKGPQRCHTATLIERLQRLEESPWSEVKLSPRMLARMLRPFGIRPSDVRAGENERVAKGYRKEHFEEAWKRYSTVTPAKEALHPLPPNVCTGMDLFSYPLQDSPVADKKSGESLVYTRVVADVAETGVFSGKRAAVLPCPVHGMHDCWWVRLEASGEMVCEKCHPAPLMTGHISAREESKWTTPLRSPQ